MIFIQYNAAKGLKDKGFDIPCFAKYFEMDVNKDEKTLISNNPEKLWDFNHMYMDPKDLNTNIMISAPIYDDVIMWFQDRNVFIETQLDQTNGVKFAYEITSFDGEFFKRETNVKEWSLYYDRLEALDAAFMEALQLIKA